MGQSVSKDGHCEGYVPLHIDPRAYALSKVHGVPLRKDALNMYPEYTARMACEDVVSMRRTGKPMHAVPKYHKILKKGLFGKDIHDPRHFVLSKVYGFRPEEIADIDRHPQYYTRDMAIQELAWQEKRKRHPEMAPFRYDMSRSIRFTNTQHGIVYKPGTKGYSHGYSYSPGQPAFSVPSPTDPRQPKKNKEKAAYERGLAEGRLRHSTTSTQSSVRSSDVTMFTTLPRRPSSSRQGATKKRGAQARPRAFHMSPRRATESLGSKPKPHSFQRHVTV